MELDKSRHLKYVVCAVEQGGVHGLGGYATGPFSSHLLEPWNETPNVPLPRTDFWRLCRGLDDGL